MSETTNTTKKSEKLEEVYIPKGNAQDEPNLFVSVNGKNYLLPKGKTSKVPPDVAYEIKRSQRAQERYDETVDKLKEQANKENE